MKNTPTQSALAASAGSAVPSHATVQFVEQWLWEGDGRETVGLPWTDNYVRDAARMIEAALAKSPNDPASAAGQEERS